jgi:hypothetical protein
MRISRQPAVDVAAASHEQADDQRIAETPKPTVSEMRVP